MRRGVGVGAGVQYVFFKMADGNFAWNRVISFSQLFCFFLEKKFFRNSPFPVRSVFVINVSLFNSTVIVKMDYEENMDNARYAANDDTPLWTKVIIILCCCMESV